jgi:hypothetical protein
LFSVSSLFHLLTFTRFRMMKNFISCIPSQCVYFISFNFLCSLYFSKRRHLIYVFPFYSHLLLWFHFTNVVIIILWWG